MNPCEVTVHAQKKKKRQKTWTQQNARKRASQTLTENSELDSSISSNLTEREGKKERKRERRIERERGRERTVGAWGKKEKEKKVKQ